MKKQFLSVILCLCMVVGMVPALAPVAFAVGNYGVDLEKSCYTWENKYYNQGLRGQCTWYCWGRAKEKCGVDLTFGGNAVDWYTNAANYGFSVGTTPRANSIAVFYDVGSSLPGYGHVVFVENVQGATVYYSEGNYLGTEYHENTFNANSGGLYIGDSRWEQRLIGYIYLNSSTSTAQPSVTFSEWNNGNFTYIRETDAAIGQQIDVSNGTCTETGMYLYDANGRQLATAKNVGYGEHRVYFKINEECRYTLTPGTTYKYKFYAVVNGQTHWSNEGSFKTTGTAPQPTLQPTPQPAPQPTTPIPALPANATTESEVNDSIERANNISANTEIVGSISKSSDVDWYVFQIPNNGHISITFDHDFVNSSSPYWKTSFYTGDNKELDSWTWKGNTTSAETGNENGVPAGTYYLRVSSSSYSSSAAYRFTVNYTPSSSWEKEFNETIVTANQISTGSEISGSIRTSSDVDWYRFELPEAGAISLTFSHDFVNSSSSYWKTTFYTSENKELNSWTWKGNATSAETGNKIGVPAGTYYLRVSSSSYSSSATYRFTVNYTSSNRWEKEFNETIVTANQISTGTEISGSIRNSSDVDWYQFDLPEAGMISLTFGHDFVNSSSSYWKTAFYTSENKELKSLTWKGNATSAETVDKIDVSAGTYYLRISSSSYNSSATYHFTVNSGLSDASSSGNEQQLIAVSGVTLSKTALSLTLGSSDVLTTEVTPSNATDKTIVWRSENTAVATVENGRVTAVGAGSTRITASCGNVTASCTISVTTEVEQVQPQPQPGGSGVHFERVNTYFQDQFTDVPANQWYTNEVSNAFELGLMKGDSGTTFNPYGNVTVAEAITMAARIHSIYTKGYEAFQQTGSKWYQVYMDYAYENGIIGLAYYNCNALQNASRAQFAEIFSNSLPAEALSVMNDVTDGAIPDVSMENRYAEYIYRLYRAGILAGSDANGTFNPTTYIIRAEAAAIVSRMAESNNRVSIKLR